MKSIGLLAVAMLFSYNILDATIWYVHPDSSMNCIQDCLDSCFTGDTVLVGPGTYHGFMWPNTQSIKLMSEYGPDTTIIDGDSLGTVIFFFWWVAADTTTTIRGFTIRGGGPVYNTGGGIFCDGSSPIIEDNIITMNVADDAGGGITCMDASPIIRHNVISYNSGSGGWGGTGGIQIDQFPWQVADVTQQSGHRSSPMIIGNTITNNTADQAGGISCFSSSSAGTIIMGNTIADNTAGSAGYGGGIFCWEASPTITDNTIFSNVALSGGGIYCSNGASPMIEDNVITDNSAAGSGGGVCLYTDCNVTLVHNIITQNSATYDEGGGIYIRNSSPTIKHCNISENTGTGITCRESSADIDSCTISWNSYSGVYRTSEAGPFPAVNWCNLNNSYPYGVYNANASDTIDAQNNWWGDASGPGGVGPGTGGWVNAAVDYEPWLTWPGIEEQLILKPVAQKVDLTPTIFRGPLQLPEGEKCKVFDVTGRVVEPTKIAPGIYFVEIDDKMVQKVIKVR